MSEQDNRLDSVFKDKVNSKEIEFREEDWLKARKLIDADRRNRKKRFLMLFFVFMSLLSIGTTLFLLPDRSGKHTAPTTPDIVSQPRSSSSNDVANDDAKDRKADVPAQQVITDERSGTANNQSSANTETIRSSATYTKQNSSPEQIRTAGNGDQPVSRKSALRRKESEQEAQTQSKPYRKNRNRKPLPPTEDMSYLLTDSASSADGPATRNQDASAIFIRTKANSPFFKAVNAECDTCLKTVDSYLAYRKPKEHRKNSLSIEAGTNVYHNGINLHGGLMYNQFVMRYLSLHTGVLYTRIHQDLPERNFGFVQYTFGELPANKSVDTKRLDYLEIPLNVGIHLTPHHAIFTGASYLYLLQSADRVTITNINGTKTETRDNGYMTVFNTYDIQAHLSYRFTHNQWYATAGYYIGFTDITDNAKYGLTQHDPNSGIRLTFGFHLW